MKRSILKITYVLTSLGIITGMTACNEEELPRPGYSKAELHASLTTNAGGSDVKIGAMTVNDFVVGTQEVNMMYLPESAVEAGVTLEIGTLKANLDAQIGKSNGAPKTLVLASGGEIKKAMIGEGETPNGTYSEATFKLYKNTEVAGNEAANGKSLFISGDLDGSPVQIWLENEEMIMASSKSEEGYEVSGQSSFLLTFNADRIFANVNFEGATDFDQDGTIEIGPNNADANGSIHTIIKNNLAASVEFEKE